MGLVRGRFGEYGGRYAPETLVFALEELDAAFSAARDDSTFQEELANLLSEFAGRPTPLYYARNLSERLGGARIYLKREDLLHGGAHKINNTLGQALLAKRMGKKRIIAETGAGQHGVASAIAASALGLKCEVYMGSEDIERQKLNVFRMHLLGAKVIPVESGSCTLKDSINEAMRDWAASVEDTHYLIGTVVGPHPYPGMVREFQRVIGEETKKQVLEREGRLPGKVFACVGGGSNAMGAFTEFIDEDVDLIAVEAAGEGLDSGKHGASLCMGTDGVLHGSYMKLLQDAYGQILPSYSISAGLDYPGVGPELCDLVSKGKVKATAATDKEALAAFKLLCETEGIIPALESSHALAKATCEAKDMGEDEIIVVNLSGRGDKDVYTVAERLGVGL